MAAQVPARPVLLVAEGAAPQRFDLWSGAGNETRNLTQSEAQEFDPALSPDGSRIAYTAASDPRERRLDLWLMNADGTGRRQLTRTGQFIFSPSWSPDGKRIAFSTLNQPLGGAPEFGMRFIEADGGEQGSLGRGLWPAWSPDGERLLFTVLDPAQEWRPSLHTARADGSEPKAVGPKEAMMGVWSPDGKRIAFVSEGEGEQADLFVMDADGGRRRRLTLTPEFEIGPQWTPDGRVLFTRLPKDQPGKARLWLLDPAEKKLAAAQVSTRDRMEITAPAAFWLLGLPGKEK